MGARVFCVTVRFLNSTYHGRKDGGQPEWPPSPLRLFQSLVAAAATRWRGTEFNESAVPALQWLERQSCPRIIAMPARLGTRYRLYVPDNVADKVAASWSRGNDASIADYRTEKDVQPMQLIGGDALHYVWALRDDEREFEAQKEVLIAAARSITHLGWGIDVVVGNAQTFVDAEAAALEGDCWQVTSGEGERLRVPEVGTLDALLQRHRQFLARLPAPDTFHPVPPLSVFGSVAYRRAGDPPAPRLAAFSFLRPDGSALKAFDAPRRTVIVAGMLRSAAKQAAEGSGWAEETIASVILGHGEALGESHRPSDGPRLGYLPLPSIEFRGPGRANVVGAVRRAIVTTFGSNGRGEVDWTARTLSGGNLVDEHGQETLAILARIPTQDRMVQRYVRAAASWATVTPVILPGYDDPRGYRRRLREGVVADEQIQLLRQLDRRIEHLLRKAIRQAGLSDELADHAEIEWSGSGFWPGTDLATRYAVPQKLRRFRRLHVRISWRDRQGNPVGVPGPICLGRGRFYGLGLFAAGDV